MRNPQPAMTKPARPLRWHLLLLVLLSSIPAFALIAFDGWKQYALLHDMAAERSIALANGIAHAQHGLIIESRQLLAALRAIPEIADRDIEGCSRKLGEFIRLSGTYENIGVVALDGSLVCSAKPLPRPVNVAEMPYFRQTLETRDFVVGGYHVSRATERPVFTVSMPIVDGRGALTGVIFAAVPANSFEREAEAIGFPARHQLTVLDSAFNVLARYPVDQWIGKSVAESPLAALLRSARAEGTAEILGLNGKERFVAYQPVHADQDGYRLFVVVGASIDDVYGQARFALIQNLIAMLLAVSAVGLGAWFGADRLVLRHVRNLVRAIDKFKSGEMIPWVARGRGSRELLVLGRAFNDMASALHDRQASMVEAQRLAQVGSWEWIVESDTVTWSEELYRIFGREPKLPPPGYKDLEQYYLPESWARLSAALEQARGSGRGFELEVEMAGSGGPGRWIAARGDAVCDASGRAIRIHGTFQDITDRKQAEMAIRRANRALRTLSAGNEELVRAASETELLQAVCRVIVEKGGFSAASVGYAQNDAEKSIKPVAWAGLDQSYISGHVQTWAETELGQRPISKTIRSGKPEVAQDILTDPSFSRWRDDVIRFGFTSNVALPISDGTRTIGALNIYAAESGAFDAEEIHLLVELANDLSYGITTLRTKAERDRIAYEHAHHEEILRKSLEDSIRAIADTVEMRDPYTAGHQRRVSELAAAIAREMNLPEERIHGIRLAATIHDVGKINVPAEILAKPGKLSDIELMLIKTHAQAGYDILKDIKFPWPIAAIVLQHHERLDGSGYPQGLKDGEIFLEARVMAVADVVEAMASHRPYRPSRGIEAALREIERGRGSVYDAQVVGACLTLFREGRFAFAA